ncbi:hypothetical protein HKCCE2091_18455 [Rhodobacterales bacterium HKCCE2091]|nr:hypothetical protein [Rhodobacterales bacterium HKCCE2091]
MRFALAAILFALALSAPVRFATGFAGLAAAQAESGSGHDGSGDRDDDDEDEDEDEDDRSGHGSGDDNSGPGSGGDRSGSGTGGGSGGGSGGAAGTGRDDAVTAEVSASGIEVTYRDGSREQVRDGMLIRRSADGTVTGTRRAHGADLVRLRAIASAFALHLDGSSGGRVRPVRIEIRGRDVTVTYSNGWMEAVTGGRYVSTDRYGNPVVSRPATDADRDRLGALAE